MLKMKKVISSLLAVAMLLSLFTGTDIVSFADESDILSYLNYTITDGEVTITGCDPSISGEVVIPDTIEGYPVTKINDYAFSWRDGITSITIPASVKTISSNFIEGCLSITNITVNENNENYSSDEYGVFFNKNKTEIIQYPAGNTRTEYSVPDGVETILSNSFYMCKNIESIIFPDSLSTIEYLSFSGCTGISAFTVDENNEYYSSDENGVLFNKDKTVLIQYPTGNSRTEYKIPDTVTEIGDYAFANCENIETVINSDNLKIINNSAFDKCLNLKSVTIPYGVTLIKYGAFMYCENLESISIPGSVDMIDSSAFSCCNKLENVIIENGVKKIREYAFSDCPSLKNVIIPASIKAIEIYAFGYVFNWDAWEHEKLDDFTIFGAPGSATEEYALKNGFAFIGCTHKNTTEYDSVSATCNAFGYSAGVQCDDCREWLSGHEKSEKISHADADKDDICDVCDYVINVFDGDILEYLTYEIKNNEVIITGCDKTIYGRYRLPSEIEGYPVTEIGWHAFMQSSFSYIEFPDTLKKIGQGAFWNSQIEIVKIPDSVEIIEGDAFGDCFSLKGIYTGKNISEISSQMLRESGSLTDVYIGKNVKLIDSWAFNLSDNIKNIYFEGTEEEWNKIVVKDNNLPLENATITFNCTDDSYLIWQPSRYNPDTFLTYSISAGKVTIEGVAWDFYGDFVIPEYIDGGLVTCIAEPAFNFLPDLDSVTIPKSVTEIQSIFGGQCFNLQNIFVDEENQYYSSVDGNLFNKDKTELLRYAIGNNRQEYTIPDTVTTINEFAFIRLSSVLKLNIPESVTDIEDYAFYDAHQLYYITVDENNPNYSSDDGVLFNKDKTELICFPGLRAGAYHWAGYEDDGIDTTIDSYTIPDSVRELAPAAFSSCSELKTVVIPESVVSIGENAFDACTSLENVNIPGSITSIPQCAFREINIKEVVIPEGVTYIGAGAFQYNPSLQSISIPDSVTYIGDAAFSNCTNLSEINLTDSKKKFGENVFYGTAYYQNKDNWENNALYIGNNLIEVSDDSITEYTVKDGTKNIACAAFYWCSNLKQLNLPDSLCSISDYAFVGMSNVEKIDIPSGITEISDYAFMQCKKLSEISIPESVTKIGKGIFFWSDNVRQINYAGDKEGWDNIEISNEENEWVSYLTINCEKEPVEEPSTQEPTTQEPTTQEPVTQEPVTQEPVTQEPVTQEPVTQEPVTQEPVTQEPATQEPVTQEPVTQEPVTQEPVTQEPVTQEPATQDPSTQAPTINVKADGVIVTNEATKTVNIPVSSDKNSVMAQIENEYFSILDSKGNNFADNVFVGTGCKIQVLDSNKNVLSEYDVIVKGDVDGNGKITAADARLALRAAAKLDILEDIYAEAANMDDNDKLTASDARLILRKAAGLK